MTHTLRSLVSNRTTSAATRDARTGLRQLRLALLAPLAASLAALPIHAQGTDSCAAPQAIAGVGTFAFDNSAAAGPADHAACVSISRDVWFAWTASIGGIHVVSTCGGTTLDTVIAVYNTATCPISDAFVCDDDNCGLQTRVEFSAVAGHVYAIQIARFGSAAGGTGTFTISGPAPACPLQIASDPDPAVAATQANSHSRFPSLSANGRFVVFESFASNFPGITDGNNRWDIYLKDRETGAFQRLSVDTDGTDADGFDPNGDSHFPDISASGRFVAFESTASDLITDEDTLNKPDIFRRDRQTNTTVRVTTGTFPSGRPAISDDGRYIAFESFANDLGPTDMNGFLDVYVKDMTLGTVSRCSRPTGGGESNGDSRFAAISGDGRWIAFESRANNLTGDATSGAEDIYIFDRTGAVTLRHLTVGAGALNNRANRPSLSFDGLLVAFESSATNLPSPTTLNGAPQIFVFDRVSQTYRHASKVLLLPPVVMGATWFPANADARQPVISGDGGRVAFYSFASNLFPGDANQLSDLFTWERASDLVRISSIVAGPTQSDGNANGPAISSDGSIVAWHTLAESLAPVDDTNGVEDVYVENCAAVFASFCAGDGSGTACPCGNSGAPGHGCANSVNPAGALLTATGNASLVDDTIGSASVFLNGSGVQSIATVLYFQGTVQSGGGAGVVFGDGKRCAEGAVVRLGIKTSSGGVSQYPSGSSLPISVQGMIAAPGVRVYQMWYRNIAAFCTADGFNLSNGIQITWGA